MTDNLTDIAIIGMAGRFPGARNIGEFWRNLCAGVESIRHFSVDELDETAKGFASSANYVKARAIIEGADEFDAAFFGIYPREAELIDPQQRIFLECCWHAFEDAGYDPQQCAEAVGVYAGCSPNSYFLRNICGDGGFAGEYTAGYQVSNVPTMLGSNFEFLPTRVAYKLNLKGPAFSLNCGCSTSLVAVCQACLSLQNYQCDMALAGGVSITFPQARGYLYEAGGMVSPDGHCRTFDAAAQGTVFGDGAGVVLLKRLEDALRDRDHVYAIIKGFGLTNDGNAKVGFSAPGVEGQVRAVAMAHASAGIDPSSITYIEAHGTGTPLGDPIEIAALTQAFRRHTSANTFCAIGAVKTNVGHLDVAAGVTGLIKTALSLHHKVLTPTLNFVTPNPALQLEDSPFYVNTALTEWGSDVVPLRAGVSAFGMGGTNAHLVLEEAPRVELAEGASKPHLLLLSAKNETAIENASSNLASHIADNPQSKLGDIAWTLMNGRRSFEVRRSMVVKDRDHAAATLTEPDPKRIVTRSTRPERPAVAFMFPGQGSQYVAMGQHLSMTHTYFYEQVDYCLKILESYSDIPLRPLLPLGKGPASQNAQIDDTLFAQPALFIVEYALARFWMDLGIVPCAMIGHSIGEFVAACVGGVFSLEDAIRLVSERGRMMHQMPAGAMLSVRLSESKLIPFLGPGLDIAGINGPALAVVAGPVGAVSELEKRLDASCVVHRRLRTSHAFHSEMMEPIIRPFREMVERVPRRPPSIPFVSTLTGDWIRADEATSPDYWSRHLRVPVRFSSGVARLRSTDWALLEVGPGNTLSTFARQHSAKYRGQLVVSSLPDKSLAQSDNETLLNALGQLWSYGLKPDWSRLYPDQEHRRIPLPGYPFERQRFWYESGAVETQRTASAKASERSRSLQKTGLIDPTSQMNHEVRDGENQITAFTMETFRNDRRAQIRTTLEAIFTDLSGLDIANLSGSTTFLEMGFDSLFLTQVSQGLRHKFGLKIKFRQLVDELSDLNALSDYVERNLSPSAAQPQTSPPVLNKLISDYPLTARNSTGPTSFESSPKEQAAISSCNDVGPGTEFDDLCRRQLQTLSEVMAKQLEVLRYTKHGDIGPLLENSAQPVLPVPISKYLEPEITSPGTDLNTSPRFRPLMENSSNAEITLTQQTYLDALIWRYNRRTATSKEITQRNRVWLADPRVAAGLRPQWKDLVYPIVAVRSKGSKLWDIDDNEYIDLVNGYGPIMLGHAPEFVTAAVQEQLQLGYETGPQSPIAGNVAKAICEMTGMERAAFCNTGSEAVTAAFRLARTVTGREKIVLFSGAYHGMFDEVLVKGLKGPNGPRSVPIAPGIPRENVKNIIVLDYATSESIEYIESHAPELAAVIIEPVQSRHPGLQPTEFLKQLRALTERSGTALIFDEVVTGFRVHPGGAQALFGIKADLATYGKVLGGGLPIGVVAGKAAFMDALDGGVWNYGDDSYPETGVTFFAGTFVRHPLALAAAAAVLMHLKKAGPDLQERLNIRTANMVTKLNSLLKEFRMPVTIEHFSSICYFSFPAEYRFAGLFYYLMRERGVYIQEGFPLFLTTAHSDDDITLIVRAFRESLLEMIAANFIPTATAIDLIPPSSATKPQPNIDGIDCQSIAATVETEPNRTPIHGATAPLRTPLTESQLEIWLSASLSDEASCAYNESFTLTLRGDLNRSVLRAALDRLIQRHEALRSTFSPEGDFQQFAPTLNIDVPDEDLLELDEFRRVNRLAEILAEEARSPFSLTDGPLVRMRLIRVAPYEHHLLFTSHHIVCDGWSINIILDELSQLYSSLSTSAECELPVALGFGSYARSQAEHFVSSEGNANEKYWVEQFKRPAASLDLPLDHSRPPIKSYKGATIRHIIPLEAYHEIKNFVAHQKCTLFSGLLAGFQALLSRLSGQGDIVVGIPAAAQSRLDNEVLVGHCVNFLPLRGFIDKDTTVAALLGEVKTALLDAYDHQNYTYGRLVRRLSIPRDPSRLPLTDIQFNLERVGAGIEFSGLKVEVDPNPKAFVNQDLFLNVIESDHGLVLDCDYNTALFDATTVNRWLTHYQTLLESIARDPNQLVSRVPLFTKAEIQHIAVEWNDTQSEYPRELYVHQLFEEQARRTPEAIAAVFDGEQLTYAELNTRADQLAAYLAGLGVGPGSLVGLFIERSLEMVVALLGVLKAGGAYVPMDPTYPAARIAFVLDDAKVPILLSQKRLIPQLPISSAHVVCLDADWDVITHANTEVHSGSPSDTDALAYLIYTSGSTGKPKGVEISHRAVVNLLSSMQKKPGIKSTDVLLAVTTLSFDIAALELLLPLCSGAKVVIASRQTASDGSRLL